MATVISEGLEIVGVSEAPATEALGKVVTPKCGIVTLLKILTGMAKVRGVGDIVGDQAPVPSSHRKSVACHPDVTLQKIRWGWRKSYQRGWGYRRGFRSTCYGSTGAVVTLPSTCGQIAWLGIQTYKKAQETYV